jgi:hypothetical protein
MMTQPSSQEQLLDRLRDAAPKALASAAGGVLSGAGKICLEVLGEPLLVVLQGDETQPPRLEVNRPAGDTRRVPWFARTLLLHYLSRADATPLAGEWVALRDLPDGTFYQTAYQGYSGNKLVRAFGNDVAAFAQAAQAAGGERLDLSDAGFMFRALPRVPLAALYWAGEDEIPPKCSVLFDRSASHFLPTDVLAALGGTLADCIIKHRG